MAIDWGRVKWGCTLLAYTLNLNVVNISREWANRLIGQLGVVAFWEYFVSWLYTFVNL